LQLKIPFKTFYITDASKKYFLNKEENIIEIKIKAREEITVKNGYK